MLFRSIQTNAFDASKDVDELIQEAEGKIFDISQTNHKKDVVSIAEIIPAAIKRIEEASKNTGFTTGIESGFYKLDELTSGWQRSDLIIMAARPAMGKTAFVLTMAKNMAIQGTPVAFFTLEMSNIQLVNRLIINAAELSGDKVKSGKLNSSEFNELSKRDCHSGTATHIYRRDTLAVGNGAEDKSPQARRRTRWLNQIGRASCRERV